MCKGLPQDALRMAPGLLRMARMMSDCLGCKQNVLRIAPGCTRDGPRMAGTRIAQDARRMSQGLLQDAPRKARGQNPPKSNQIRPNQFESFQINLKSFQITPNPFKSCKNLFKSCQVLSNQRKSDQIMQHSFRIT